MALAAVMRGLAPAQLVRMTPWRALRIVPDDVSDLATLAATAAIAGWITDAAAPILRVDACPGAPACRSATLDTRAAALALAPRLAELGLGSLHVSGCAKGCARSAPADLVLVGCGDAWGVISKGRAGDAPSRLVAADDLAGTPLSALCFVSNAAAANSGGAP